MDNFNYVRSAESYGLSGTFAKLMRNVYSWMTGSLLLTALTAMLVARNEEWVYTLATTSGLLIGLMIAEVVLVVWLSARIMKMSFAQAGLMMVAYSVLNGVTLSFVLLAYTGESVAQTFFVTAGTFGAMSLTGFFIKKDLSGIGRFLMMTLFGLIIATVVNMFMQNTGMALLLNYVGVLVFSALTAYDTQKIKQMLLEYSQYGETDETNKIALMGSLSLYLDFVNLFLYLLRFMGDRK